MVIEDIKLVISLRYFSRISRVQLSGYYYTPRERTMERIDPSIREMIKEIASEYSTYRYRRVWVVLRNQGTRVKQKTVRKVLKDSNLSLPAHRHKGCTKKRNLFRPHGPDQLLETNITYIPTESGMTYLTCIKETFTKE